MFEHLVEAVFSSALEGISHQSRRPAKEDATEAFFGVDGTPGLDIGAVEFGVDLATAFHLIPRALAYKRSCQGPVKRIGDAVLDLQWTCKQHTLP